MSGLQTYSSCRDQGLYSPGNQLYYNNTTPSPWSLAYLRNSGLFQHNSFSSLIIHSFLPTISQAQEKRACRLDMGKFSSPPPFPPHHCFLTRDAFLQASLDHTSGSVPQHQHKPPCPAINLLFCFPFNSNTQNVTRTGVYNNNYCTLRNILARLLKLPVMTMPNKKLNMGKSHNSLPSTPSLYRPHTHGWVLGAGSREHYVTRDMSICSRKWLYI